MAVHWTREKLDVDVGLLFASGCALGAFGFNFLRARFVSAIRLSLDQFPAALSPLRVAQFDRYDDVLAVWGDTYVHTAVTHFISSKIERTEADALGTFETFSRLLFRACRAAPLYCVCGAPT